MYKPDSDNVTEISNSSSEINGKHTNYLVEMSQWKLHTDGLGHSIFGLLSIESTGTLFIRLTLIGVCVQLQKKKLIEFSADAKISDFASQVTEIRVLKYLHTTLECINCSSCNKRNSKTISKNASIKPILTCIPIMRYWLIWN